MKKGLSKKVVLVCNVKNTFVYKDIKLLEKIGFKVLLIYSPPYKDPLRFFYNRIKELVLSFFYLPTSIGVFSWFNDYHTTVPVLMSKFFKKSITIIIGGYDAVSNSNLNYGIFLKNNLKDINKHWPKKLPNGIIHGDLFIDNIFFKNDKLSGIIDFYFAANDYFMYEIAICVNALCFDQTNSKFYLNKKKVKCLIKGYEKIKKLSSKEKNSLNILCRGAALRYFLTRLYDYTNTPKTAFIKIKNPREYYQKLVTHNKLKTYKDYL